MWLRVLGAAAGLWSLVLTALGAGWSAGAAGYPFGPVAEDRTSCSILEGMPAGVVGPGMVLTGLLGLAAAAVLVTGRGGRLRMPVLLVAAVSAVGFVAVVPDYTVIAVLAMWPAILVFSVTGVPGPQDGVGDIIYWHRGFLLIVFLAGVLWAVAGTVYARRSAGRCARCGRGR